MILGILQGFSKDSSRFFQDSLMDSGRVEGHFHKPMKRERERDERRAAIN